MSSSGRQRLAIWVLTRCAPDYRCESFIGDLLEQYQERGVCWYWRQVLGAVLSRTVRAFVTATETDVPAAEFVGDLVMSIALGTFAVNQLPVYADLFFGSAVLVKSEMSTTVVSALIVGAFILFVAVVHEVRIRIARVP